MARTFRQTPLRDVGNALMRTIVRVGIGLPGLHTLTTVGRRTGQPRSNPVRLIEHAGQRYLVAPYGEVAWVRNVRAAGRFTLSRAGRDEEHAVHEVSAEEAAPVLRAYLQREIIVRPYFDAAPDDPDDAFVAEAHRHPVFALRPG